MANRHAALEDDSLARAGRDAQVGFLGLAEAVDQAAQDADPQRVLQVLHLVFDLGDDPLEVDIEPAAGRAGDDLGLGHAAVAGAQDVEAGRDLGDRVAQQRDADRVADAAQHDRADAGRALERAVLARARLGDADVGGIVALRGVLGVARDGRRHVAGLQADDHQVVAQPLGHLDIAQRAFDHGLGTGIAVLVDQVFLEASGIDADPHRDAFVPGLADDFLESLVAADIAGVDPDLVDGGLARGRRGVKASQRHPVVVVNISDQRDADPIADQLAGFDVFLLGDGHAHDLAAGFFQSLDLCQRCGDVERVGRRHRLDRDRMVAADDVIANTHLPRLVPLDGRRVGHRLVVLKS